jgi:WD40 repeat protein
MLFRFLFGDDIFISYSRADGAAYAAALANELSKPGRDFSCFLDQWGASAGNDLSKPVLRALRRSSVLVLIGTPCAIGSKFVRQEVDSFSQQNWPRAHRPILPVNINGALDEVGWEKLNGLHLTPETEEARAKGLPSESVIRLIVNSHTFTKRNQRVRRLSIGAFALLIASIAASALAWQQSRRANEEKRNAIESAQKARENEKEAKIQAALAESQTAEAKQQENIARSRKLASDSGTMLRTDPGLSFNLASEAVQLSPTVEAEEAFKQALVESRLRKTISGRLSSYGRVFNPEGRLILSNESKAQVWDLNKWKQFPEYGPTSASVRNAIFSPSGKLILTEILGPDIRSTIQVIDANSRQVRPPLKGLSSKHYIAAVSPDDRFIILNGGGGEPGAEVWDLLNGEKMFGIERTDRIGFRFTFNQDSRLFSLIQFSGPAQIWDLVTREEVSIFKANGDGFKNAVFSPDGQSLLTLSNGKAQVWDTTSRKQLFEIDDADFYSSDRIEFSPDSKLILIRWSEYRRGKTRHKVKVWDATMGKNVRPLEDAPENPNASIVFSPKSNRIFIASADQTASIKAIVYNASTGKKSVALEAIANYIKSAEFSRDGKLLLTINSNSTAQLWDTESGKEVFAFKGSIGSVKRAIFSPDSKHILIEKTDIDYPGKVYVYPCPNTSLFDNYLELHSEQKPRRPIQAALSHQIQ